MSKCYMAFNGPKVTTAAPASVTTGTALKTLMQISPPSTKSIEIVQWGISFDGTSGIPIKCELMESDVAATVTAYVAADVAGWNCPNDEATLITLGTANSGYTATVEGTPATTRMFDLQLVSPAGGYTAQYPLGDRPILNKGKFLRVRVTAPVAVNAYTYVVWEE